MIHWLYLTQSTTYLPVTNNLYILLNNISNYYAKKYPSHYPTDNPQSKP